MSIFTPTNQIKLTNVAIMRLKRAGKRFELACYPNKVNAWKDGIETKIDEVLQIDEIFVNVSKGEVAKKEVLEKCFETTDKREIVKQILEKGQLQLGQKEREVQMESLYKDIANIISEKCVNNETQRPVTPQFVERAMREMHVNINVNKTAKKQALIVIKKLEEKYPIQRAQMRLKILADEVSGKKLVSTLKHEVGVKTIEKEDWESGLELICLIDPGTFRALDEAVRIATKGEGKVEVLSLAAVDETDLSLDDKEDEEKEKAKPAAAAAGKKEVPAKGGKGKRKGKKGRRGDDSEDDEDFPKKEDKSKAVPEDAADSDAVKPEGETADAAATTDGDSKTEPAEGAPKKGGKAAAKKPVEGDEPADDEDKPKGGKKKGAAGKKAAAKPAEDDEEGEGAKGKAKGGKKPPAKKTDKDGDDAAPADKPTGKPKPAPAAGKKKGGKKPPPIKSKGRQMGPGGPGLEDDESSDEGPIQKPPKKKDRGKKKKVPMKEASNDGDDLASLVKKKGSAPSPDGEDDEILAMGGMVKKGGKNKKKKKGGVPLPADDDKPKPKPAPKKAAADKPKGKKGK